MKKLASRLMLVAASILVFAGVPGISEVGSVVEGQQTSIEIPYGLIQELMSTSVTSPKAGASIAILPILGLIALVAGLIAAIVAIITGLVILVKWIWKMARKGYEKKKWEEFKEEILNNINDCLEEGGDYTADHPPLWVCEGENEILFSGDYSDIFLK